jgi:hypothetical protein
MPIPARLIVAGAILAVLRADLLIAERLKLRESFFESRSHICVVSKLKNRDNVWGAPPLEAADRKWSARTNS